MIVKVGYRDSFRGPKIISASARFDYAYVIYNSMINFLFADIYWNIEKVYVNLYALICDLTSKLWYGEFSNISYVIANTIENTDLSRFPQRIFIYKKVCSLINKQFL